MSAIGRESKIKTQHRAEHMSVKTYHFDEVRCTMKGGAGLQSSLHIKATAVRMKQF